MRESRTYGSVRGACDETHVPTATTPGVHRGAWPRRRGRWWGGRSSRAMRVIGVADGLRCDRPGGTSFASTHSRRGCRDLGWTERPQICGLSIAGLPTIPTCCACLAAELVPRWRRILILAPPSTPVLAALLRKSTHHTPWSSLQVTDPVGSGFIPEFGETGRQCHRLHPFRVLRWAGKWLQRLQGDRASLASPWPLNLQPGDCFLNHFISQPMENGPRRARFLSIQQIRHARGRDAAAVECPRSMRLCRASRTVD